MTPCPICAAPVRISARPGFHAASCGHSLLTTADGVIVASRDLRETARRAQAFIERVESGALLPEGKTAPYTKPLAACVTTREHSGTAERKI